jgi:SSS family solute:Na+ symporter/sodium/proline symporter
MVLASFIAFLLVFLIIGIASAFKSRGTKADYYLASSSVAPWLVALSAVATNNSGYMFIGVIGFTYAAGLSAVWLMIGWIAGDFIASLYIHRELRISTGRTSEITFAGVLSRWGGRDFRTLRIVAALITLAFLGAYAAAQLSAGGKALQAIFDWDPRAGAFLVAGAVATYCLAGGIRASIWTDAAQSLIMISAMATLLYVAIFALGGPSATWRHISEVPGYLNWFPDDLLIPGATGPILFAVGWLFAGFSVVGQPHIMVRFMALDDPSHLARARIYYYSYFIAFYLLATGVGVMARLHLPDLGALDPELALPTMALKLLPPALIGLVLAGIFAATMSTADSLVLACASALSHDLVPRRLEKGWQIKGVTLLVTLFALGIALSGNQSVFALVIMAWSTLASAFAPLMLVYATKKDVGERTAIAMMLIGVMVAFAWRQMGLHNDIYEGMPGMLAGLATYYLISWRSGRAAAVPRTTVRRHDDPD